MPPLEINYDDAVRRKNQARGQQRADVQDGRVNPQAAQRRASLFHGVPSRVLSYGQGAGI